MSSDPMTPLVKRDDDDPFERALLRAGQRERAPEDAERRLLVALGVGGGSMLSTFFGAKHLASLGTKGALVSVAVIAGVLGATAWLISSPPPVTTPPPVHTVPIPAAEAPPPAPRTVDPAGESIPSTRVEDLPTSQPPARSAPALVTPPLPSTESAPSLAREVALLEAARAALARGDATDTLHQLDVHDREFPTGPLLPESQVLRIETFVRAGGPENTARARALGDAFLAKHTSGPQARRVRAVLERAP